MSTQPEEVKGAAAAQAEEEKKAEEEKDVGPKHEALADDTEQVPEIM